MIEKLSHKIEITGYTKTHCGECDKHSWKGMWWCVIYKVGLEPNNPLRCSQCLDDESEQKDEK